MIPSAEAVLKDYQIRKKRKQKEAFVRHVSGFAEKEGWKVQIQKGYGAKNLLVGDLSRARVVFAAHYDTCPQLPFPNFITPKSLGLYLLYQGVLTVALFLAVFVAAWVLHWGFSFLGDFYFYDFLRLALWGLLALLFFGPANPHTANDNTSGVIVLMEMIHRLPPEKRDQAAFVFFDLEEVGTVGSAAFAGEYRKEMKNKPLINFDCVSDGDHFLFVTKKKAARLVDLLTLAFPNTREKKVEVLTRGYVYPSDQVNFPLGVGVAALKKTKRGLLYMDRIHTKKDTVFREENIRFLTEGSLRLLELLEKEEETNEKEREEI